MKKRILAAAVALGMLLGGQQYVPVNCEAAETVVAESVAPNGSVESKKWWHDKVAYQIYPKSFKDTDGDGTGDLKGIISKMDYLKNLGVDIIWISPIYKSPFIDQGYDISDYYAIDEKFGTMEDFDNLLAEAKKRDMHIIMDLVVNHCSSEHELFKKAMADPEGEYGKYFYIREGKDGKVPNNARSFFGGSCWEPVPNHPNKFYYHSFAVQQPDLNWENEKVRKDVYKMINWWLDKGLSGFRIDAIMNVKKDTSFPDLPADGADGMFFCPKIQNDTVKIGPVLEDLKKNTFAKYDAFTVGEVFANEYSGQMLSDFIGSDGHFSTMFDFTPHFPFYGSPDVPIKVWRDMMFGSLNNVKHYGFEANVLANHDGARCASKFLPAYAQNDAGIKALGTVSVLLRGIPFIYQGQEIGMRNAEWNSVEEFNDIQTRDQYKNALNEGLSPEEALKKVSRSSRDNARTSMQWSAEKNGGFTTGTPWLKTNEQYKTINVEAQEKDKDSILNYYRDLISLRKSPEYKDVFVYGDVEQEFADKDSVVAYVRKGNDKTIHVIANLGDKPEQFSFSKKPAKVLLSNMNRKTVEKDIELKSCEVIVVEE